MNKLENLLSLMFGWAKRTYENYKIPGLIDLDNKEREQYLQAKVYEGKWRVCGKTVLSDGSIDISIKRKECSSSILFPDNHPLANQLRISLYENQDITFTLIPPIEAPTKVDNYTEYLMVNVGIMARFGQG